MKKKAILMVLLFALITSVAMSSQFAYCENCAPAKRDVSTADIKNLGCIWHGYIIHRTGFPKPIGVPWLYNYKTDVDGYKQLCVGQGSTLLARSYFRGFAQWYVADIPSDADVTDVKLRFYVPSTIDPRIGDWVSTYECDMDIYQMSNPPSAWGRAEGAMLYGDFTLFDDAYDGHLYTWEWVTQGDGWVEVDLGPQAELDLEAKLSGGIAWFAVGFHEFTDHADGTGVERGVSFYCVYLDVTYTVAKVDTVLDFWFTPNPAKPGETVELKGTLKTVGGSPLPPAAQVEVEYSTDGGATWHHIWTLWTNWLSEFSKTFTAPGVGEYLVRVCYAGSAVYNPSCDTETLIVQPEVWGDYHFRLSPYTDVIHIKISGSVIYGVAEVQGVGSDLPLLGYIQGGTFYIFTDVPDGLYANEMSMMVGSTSTLSGNVYRTKDGKSWDGPTPFTLVSASSASGSSAMGQALASAVEPQGWPATYHFQLSPWIDVVHLHVDAPILHGLDDAAPFYYDQPVLGYISGSFFILGFDWTSATALYELCIIRASTSTMSGFAYRTTTGKSYISGPTISFVSVPP